MMTASRNHRRLPEREAARLTYMGTAKPSNDGEAYTLLRGSYDAAFQELIDNRRNGAQGESVRASEETVRYHRDRVAEFLLTEREPEPDTQSRLRVAAYFIWLNAGSPAGTAVSDWIFAEREAHLSPV
ncbi:MAG: DUF2934 domain-containing protein [Bryobacteraceae bacterium]|nr:DUF2934 domain-containing protein [Bryobacteraceae bacterium]